MLVMVWPAGDQAQRLVLRRASTHDRRRGRARDLLARSSARLDARFAGGARGDHEQTNFRLRGGSSLSPSMFNWAAICVGVLSADFCVSSNGLRRIAAGAITRGG